MPPLNWDTGLPCQGLLTTLPELSTRHEACSGQTLEGAEPCRNLVLEKLCRAEQGGGKTVFFGSLASERK